MICEEVDITELIMLQKFGLENGDGVIDRAEFIILCMVRMGTDPNPIEFISDRFAEVDDDGGGTLSTEDITHGKYLVIDGEIKPALNTFGMKKVLLKVRHERILMMNVMTMRTNHCIHTYPRHSIQMPFLFLVLVEL